MACLLKLPTNNSKGVVTFTTQEQKLINSSRKLKNKLVLMKSQYVTGLHLNWHDFSFKPDQKFDFFMANQSDIIAVDTTPFELINIDACNFTPAIYTPSKTEKFWDILIIGNPVYFKRPEVALKTVRKLYDKYGKKRVLYICPIPKYEKKNEKTVFYNIREYYESLFSKEEQQWFTLLTTSFNSPFPFDRKTLSVFYKNSKVFLHTPLDERRCRIAAYAWCAGLPVVARQSVASILPRNLQCEPAYYRVDNDSEYIDQIAAALKNDGVFDVSKYQNVLSEKSMVTTLEEQLISLFDKKNLFYEGNLLSKNLDLRLGWHHQNIGGSQNGLSQSLTSFIQELRGELSYQLDYQKKIINAEYPEKVIAQELDFGSDINPDDVLKNSKYLSPLGFYEKMATLVKMKLTKIIGNM
jgi:hypothetical protein